VVQDPRPGDSVAAWLHPSLAARLERAGLLTLVALVERINGIGARWWVQVPGVGELKAARILDWLHASEQVLGLRIGAHAAQPRAQLTPTALAAVVPAATALRPYEKFVLPAAELDGSAGRFRAPQENCLLMATNDHQAIGAWLASKRPDSVAGDLSSTQRSYRKEAERLCSGRFSNARRRSLGWQRKTPPSTTASSWIRLRPGAHPGIISAGRRRGGRSKDR